VQEIRVVEQSWPNENMARVSSAGGDLCVEDSQLDSGKAGSFCFQGYLPASRDFERTGKVSDSAQSVPRCGHRLPVFQKWSGINYARRNAVRQHIF
jgi:hypothetical protein